MAPRLRCATRERRVRGRPAPGLAPPWPVGLELDAGLSRLATPPDPARLGLSGVPGTTFPLHGGHRCGPALGGKATWNYCICQQYFRVWTEQIGGFILTQNIAHFEAASVPMAQVAGSTMIRPPRHGGRLRPATV